MRKAGTQENISVPEFLIPERVELLEKFSLASGEEPERFLQSASAAGARSSDAPPGVHCASEPANFRSFPPPA
jgi:hypothetical protein